MNRKITLLALAGRGDFFGASGLPNFVTPSAATACLAKKLSSDRRPVRASPVKPAPASQRNSRRVLPQKERAGPDESEERRSMTSLHRNRSIEVAELVEVQHHEAEVFQRRLVAGTLFGLQG